MSNCAKRYLITITLLSITAFATFGSYSERSYPGTLYAHNVPLMIGNWFGRDMPTDERTYKILETRDTFTREYKDVHGKKVMLTVVFAQNNRKVAHPPEVCLAGGGWSRSDRDIQEVLVGHRTVTFNRIVLQKGSEKRMFIYLYKVGDRLTANYYFQQLNVILNGILRKSTSSALIEVSCLTSDTNIETSVKTLEEFAEEAIPILEEHLP